MNAHSSVEQNERQARNDEERKRIQKRMITNDNEHFRLFGVHTREFNIMKGSKERFLLFSGFLIL